MNNQKQKEIISKNINNFLDMRNLNQSDVAKAIGVSPQTFNTWCKGIAIPRMGKMQALADYFHVNKSDIIDDKSVPLTQPAEIVYEELIKLNDDNQIRVFDLVMNYLICNEFDQGRISSLAKELAFHLSNKNEDPFEDVRRMTAPIKIKDAE